MKTPKKPKRVKPEYVSEELETQSINNLLAQTDILIRECQELIERIEADLNTEDELNSVLDLLGTNKKTKKNK
jgi:hypothetical protein